MKLMICYPWFAICLIYYARNKSNSIRKSIKSKPFYLFTTKADDLRGISQIHRLCVYASGSFFTDIFICFTSIKVSCLHLGQNKGKFSKIVSSRILTLVLLLHIGHVTHFCLDTTLPPYSMYFVFYTQFFTF